MKVTVCNEKTLQRLDKRNFADLNVNIENLAIISIRDCEDEPIILTNKPPLFLSLAFDDVIPGDGEGMPISDEQARVVAEFVLKNRDKIRMLVCQCTYGQSRSAAVAAAVMEYFAHRGIKIFADDRYFPNKNVFRKVLSALQNFDSDIHQ